MEPYQKAAEALRSSKEYPLQLLKNAGLTALGGGAAALGSKALNSLIPAVGAMINNYIPEKLSIAGLNKIDPRLGKFIQGAMEEGYGYEELREFIGDKVQKTQKGEQKNLIQQESPELHQFIDQEIRSGMTPLQAGAKASVDKKFTEVIKKLVKSHKMPWANILETIYGNAEQALPPSNQSQGQQQQQQPMQGQQQQSGQGQQALMAILSQINQRLGQ